MDYKALHRFADVGARKIRLFADLIRGKNVDEAIQLLRFYPNRSAKLLLAVVESAHGNADHLECPDPDGLVVSECRVDGAPMFKRIQPRARGTAFQIKKRMSHIHVTLSDPLEETLPTNTFSQTGSTSTATAGGSPVTTPTPTGTETPTTTTTPPTT